MEAGSLSCVALVAAKASLDDPGWTADVRRKTIAGRDRLHAILDQMSVDHSPSRANFVFFRSPVEADGFRSRLAEAGILVGRVFPPLDQWRRITVGTEAQTDKCILALKRALADHPKSAR